MKTEHEYQSSLGAFTIAVKVDSIDGIIAPGSLETVLPAHPL